MWINAILVLTGIFTVQGDHWGYPVEQPNGVIKGDENWGGQCGLGRKQSPVDLAEDAAVLGRYPPLEFIDYSKPIPNGKVRNSGHSIQIDIPPNQRYLMTGGGLPGTYRMDQMHFHWASEHTINNNRYGLELHIVSHDTVYKNFSEALKHKNGIAVLGVLFHVSGEKNIVLKNILDSTEPVKDGPGASSALKLPFAPGELLPKDQKSFFRYEGSLTTPTCDEAVIWTVLTSSVPFEMHQIERFKEIKDEVGENLTHNFRQLQRLNSRPLVYVSDRKNSMDGSKSSANSLVTISISTLILLTIFGNNCFFTISNIN